MIPKYFRPPKFFRNFTKIAKYFSIITPMFSKFQIFALFRNFRKWMKKIEVNTREIWGMYEETEGKFAENFGERLEWPRSDLAPNFGAYYLYLIFFIYLCRFCCKTCVCSSVIHPVNKKIFGFFLSSKNKSKTSVNDATTMSWKHQTSSLELLLSFFFFIKSHKIITFNKRILTLVWAWRKGLCFYNPMIIKKLTKGA